MSAKDLQRESAYSLTPEEVSMGQKFRLKLLNAANSKYFSILMIVATVYALWGTDLYELIGPSKSNDTGLYATIFIVFILFIAEFTVFSTCKDGYVLSFFFWLDGIASLSLLPDVLMLFGVILFTGNEGSSVTVARAGRAARAGSRAARIVRVLKLISMLRKSRQKEGEGELKESKIGGQLAELITQKVIVIVGAMLISTSLLDLIATTASYSFESELSNLELIQSYSYQVNNASLYQDMLARFIVSHDIRAFSPSDPYSVRLPELATLVGVAWPPANSLWLTGSSCAGRSLRYLSVAGQEVWCNIHNADDLRKSPAEYEMHVTPNNSTMIIDQRPYARGQALVNIVQILFIVVLLGISSALFNHDAETLVIRPLAKMAALVHKMSDNPLAEIADSTDGGDYETDFVESALKKFGKLLQVAFGEAGAEIIGANMSNGGELNLMMAGRKLDAIFGFVVIFHFSECTECLQEDIMTFVNQVAEYIHIAVAQNEGFTNKNIGEAWLLAWRMPDDNNFVNFTKADSALKSFIRVALQTWVCPRIRQLTEHPKIQEKLPGYRISMGFGLHVGWAIQGAIGSPQKIDASFLSPNVNLASRLEAANHQFHTTILFSGQIYALLTPPVQSLCRKIDRVTVKGSAQPLELWTYDVPFESFEDPDELRIKRGVSYWEQFSPATTASYRARYSQVTEHYLGGRWPQAKEVLDACLRENPEDGPGNALHEIMSKHNFVAPSTWPGYRELTEK